MRITEAAKQETRTKILEAARALFVGKGFEQTTTRDIAQSAGIAAGTLFNYFPSKEALGMQLIAEALDRADTGSELPDDLEEALFAEIMAGLRALQPYRGFVGAVIESGLSPFSSGNSDGPGQRIRTDHLERVSALIAHYHSGGAPPVISMHVYWTLYLGALSFWAADDSPHQEDTLALLDHSLKVFVRSLADRPEGNARA